MLAGDAVVVAVSFDRVTVGEKSFETSCDAGTARRWPFGAEAPVVGLKILGSVEASGSVVTASLKSDAAATNVTRASPLASVCACCASPVPPREDSVRSTPGSAFPAAERTRTLAVALLPAVSDPGRLAT